MAIQESTLPEITYVQSQAHLLERGFEYFVCVTLHCNIKQQIVHEHGSTSLLDRNL